MIYKVIFFLIILYLLFKVFKKYKETFDTTNNDIFFKLVLTDDKNVRYQLVTFSQLETLYQTQVLLNANTNDNSNMDFLFQNSDKSIDDLKNILVNINKKKRYTPFNDVLLAIKESDIQNSLINFNAGSIIFKNILEPLYFDNNRLLYNEISSKCFDSTNIKPSLYLVGNMPTITCSNNPINKGLKINQLNYDENTQTLNCMHISLYNISKLDNQPNVYEIMLTPNKTNISISKEILNL
jgi:hypothetical protein